MITALDINDNGQILGASNNGGPTGTGGIVIRELDGSLNYFVQGTWVTERPYSIVQLTNGGKVLGQSYWGGSSSSVYYPWIWSPEHGLVDISASGRIGFVASQMNDRGRVVGSHYNCFSSLTAVAYNVDERLLRFLDPDHGKGCRSSDATAVNDHGDVVGWARTGGNPDMLPFMWDDIDGWRILSGSVAPNRDEIRPTDINNLKQVVGRFNLAGQSLRTSFFYWDEDNGFHDLKKLLDPDDPMTAQVILNGDMVILVHFYAPKINDRGEILVTGSLRGENLRDGPRHAFLLVPVQKQSN